MGVCICVCFCNCECVCVCVCVCVGYVCFVYILCTSWCICGKMESLNVFKLICHQHLGKACIVHVPEKFIAPGDHIVKGLLPDECVPKDL